MSQTAVPPGASAPSGLTPLQRAQLRAAVAYHTLVNPEGGIGYRVEVGGIHEMPRLTDGTIDPAEPHLRRIRLGHAEATPATTRPPAPLSLPRRVYAALERTAPVLTDAVREAVMRRREREIAAPLPRHPEGPDGPEVAAATEREAAPADPPPGAARVVLFGLHWLQTGGAERWAIESIALAKAAGLMPIVVVDQNSVHPWLTRPELEGCLVIAQSFETHRHPVDLALTRALLEKYEVVGAMIHHSEWLYRSLPYLKRHRPGIPVVDSLHIVEYLRGGYAGTAVEYDAFVDTHHVISPQLVRWLSEVQGVDPGKLALAPLTTLTAGGGGAFRPADPAAPFTIAFVGRFSRQKRPDLFLALAHRLRRRGVAFRAVMQGDGERRDLVEALLDRYRLRDVVELRDESFPVARTLAEAELLVVTSINEGLTLTTFEAVAAGVPVLSADVGSQYTIVEGELLAPRPARAFLRSATELIRRLAAGDERAERLRLRAWEAQRDRVRAFGEYPDAHHYFERLFAQWQA